MTNKILGLSPRWQVSFDWRLLPSLAPRYLGDLLVARAGSYVVGLDPATGVVAWKHRVTDLDELDGFEFEVCGDVVVTDWRHPVTKRRHLQAVAADGTRRWDVEVGSIGGARVLSVGARALAATTLGETAWELVTLDADGNLTRRTLPYPSGRLARLEDGTWVLGSSGMARGKPPLYALRGDDVVPIDALKQVFWIVATPGGALTVERSGRHNEVVARDLDLRPRWRANVANDLMATSGSVVFAFAGERDQEIQIALDLRTGDERWRGVPLPTPAGLLSASGELVLAEHEKGAVLFSADGTLLGEHAGRVGRLYVSGKTAYLFVDKSLVCLELP